MHLIYMDESGNTGTNKDADQPFHLIAGLLVHEAAIRSIELAVSATTKKHFGAAVSDEGFELHGTDLYSGNGHFKNVPPASRVACINEILDALAQHDVKVMWSAVDKIKLYTQRHPHQLAFLFLVERVEDWLRRQGALGLFVADENKEIEQRLIDDLEGFKLGGTAMGWRPTKIDSVVDSIHFVQSKNNKLIQCADIVAYFALKDFRQNLSMIEEYRALSGSRIPWLAWRSGFLTQKRQAILDIGIKIDRLTIAKKRWP